MNANYAGECIPVPSSAHYSVWEGGYTETGNNCCSFQAKCPSGCRNKSRAQNYAYRWTSDPQHGCYNQGWGTVTACVYPRYQAVGAYECVVNN